MNYNITQNIRQNIYLELYGLTSIIDDSIFGDLKSFRSQFGHNKWR